MPPSSRDSSFASDDAAAFAASGAVCRRHARGFYFASAFLSPSKRQAIYSVYAFCRLIRQTFAPPCPGIQIPGLDELERRLDDMYANRLELPRAEFRSEEQHVLHAAAIVVRRYEIPRQYFLELAEGCRADSAVQRYATWAALEKHCCQTSGVVALMMSCVLGVAHSDAGQYAAALGNALRLTNILRDIKQDISRGRVYLPLEDMVRFNYSERDLAGGVVNRNLRALIRFQVDRARQLYQHAADGICWLAGEGARLLAAIVIVQHGEILDAIERRQFDVRSVESSWPRMMMRLGRVRNLARRQPGEPLPRVI